MVHVIRRLSLSRRTFLRGAGASLALPWLDAMTPALRPQIEGPTRSLFVFAPNGVKMDDWTPANAGREFSLPHILQPLESVRRQVIVLSNAGIRAGMALGDGPGDHARASATYLTCVHPRKTGGADIRAGVSIDQVLARHIGGETQFPSLEFGMEAGRKAGACDSGYSCAYTNNISWRDPSTPVAKEVNPRAAFERMFGDLGADPEAEARRRRRLASVLDAAMADVKSVAGKLGPADRDKLDGYLTAVRSFEKRLQKVEAEQPKVAVPKGLEQRDDSPRFVARLQLMYELIALAYETDLTRTITFMLGNAGSNRSYPFLGVPDGHHQISHHGKKPEKLAKIRKINRFHCEQFALFLKRLEATDEGGKSLLHRSMIVYGSAIGDGNRHDHLNLPIVIAGGGNGRFDSGRHLSLAPRTPMANVYLAMLDAQGIEEESFGDSSGRVEL